MQTMMNNGALDTTQAAHSRPAPRQLISDDALTRAKRDLMQAEVRLAKARATVVSAEIDIKTLTARLKSLVK
jgi:hypothetical protein